MGSWKSIYNLSQKDENGNVFIGNVIAINCKNCYVYSTQTTIAISDINNQIIVNTEDIFINMPLDKSYNIHLLYSLNKSQET